MDRRKFLKVAGLTTLGSIAAGMVYPFLEAKWCRVVRTTIALPNLLTPFRGTTVALLADVHHGPFVPLAYIRHVVSMTNALKPDIVALVGDFVHRHDTYIAPGIHELGKLKGTLGRFAVRGNHDNQDYYGRRSFRPLSQAALAEAKLPDLITRESGSSEAVPGCESVASATSGPTIKTWMPPWATPPRAMQSSFCRTILTLLRPSATAASAWC